MMRGYDAPRGVSAPPRDPRLYSHHHYRTQGPSPWTPAIVLGVIVLITVTPYLRSPAAAAVAYHNAVRPSSRFPAAVLWIPVLGVIALQLFSGPWYHGYGQRRAFGQQGPGIPGYPSGAYGGAHGAYARRLAADFHRTSGWPWWSSSSSLWNPHHRYYNIHHQRGLVASFMDYGGHWLLILLGIATFTLVSSSSFPIAPAPHSWGVFF